jgi:high-affinity iron transporter
MILIRGAVAVAAAALPSFVPETTTAQSPAPIVRRLAATAQLAAQEYRIGVVDGRVVAQAEVDEARLFLQESRRSAAQLPRDLRPQTLLRIDSVIRLVDRRAAPDSIEVLVRALTHSLSERLGVVLDEIPAATPSLSRGKAVYQASCAGCHGDFGRGDGPLAPGLDPKPADLSDPVALRDQSPLDYYRRITIGVVGTAMPAFETRLSPEDRWAAALHATLLRLPPGSGTVPVRLQTFSESARLSDAELLTALGETDTTAAALARLAAVRRFQADASSDANAQVFARVRVQLESTYVLARQGDTSAAARALDAYMSFEQVERGVRAKNPELAAELEAAFAALRTLSAGATNAELVRIRKQLEAGLERAERVLADEQSPANLFLQSFVILLREGLEAILLVGALITVLVKMGAAHRRRDIHIGVGAAVVASLLTAVALETIFHLTPAKREALEGITMVVATLVLFYVSYWLLSKIEVGKWNQFVKHKVQDALTSGSGLALASAAFLAVYREGFETVLFYKALFLSGGSSGATMPILGGIVLGSLAMVAVYVAISRFGVRLPLKPFFGITSAFLYYMAFVLGGRGVADLQVGGLLPTTIVPGAPRVPALGIYPTLESLLVQGVLLVLLIGALVWTFILEPRQRKAGREMPELLRPQRTGFTGPSPQEVSLELARSVEPIEADLETSEPKPNGTKMVRER